jgi:type I restriction enzyme M protein
MDEIEENDYNLNISRYVSTAEPEPEINLAEVHRDLASIEEDIQASAAKHNTFLKELGLPPLPGFEQ